MQKERLSNLNILSEEDLNSLLENFDPEDFSEEENKLITRSQCYYDIEFFSHFITERWTSDKKTGTRYQTPDFHKKLWQLVSSGKDVCCIVPRGFGKTTAVSKILVLWMLLFRKEPSILLLMSKGLGEKVIGDIRRELETNEKIRLVWGDVVPISNKIEKTNEKWRQRHLQLLNGCEVESLTKGEPIRGNRPTKIIVDDPQENKDVKNPIMADEFYNWFFTSVHGSLNAEEGSVAVLGTLISNNCFVNKLKQEADQKGFQLVQFPAIINFDSSSFTGDSLWPDRWPIDKLKERLGKMGQREFMQEFMNVPFVLNGSPVFTDQDRKNLVVVKPLSAEDGLKWFVSPEQRGELEVFIGGDLALGSTDGDYTVFIGRTVDGRLVFQYRGHITQDRMASLLDTVVRQFKAVFIVPENNNAAAFIIETKKYSWRSNLYKQKSIDKVIMKDQDKYGFNTNDRTKPILIGDLRKFMTTASYQVSEEEMEELQYYYYNESDGGMSAISPYHDDTVMSDAMCVQGIVRGRVSVGVY